MGLTNHLLTGMILQWSTKSISNSQPSVFDAPTLSPKIWSWRPQIKEVIFFTKTHDTEKKYTWTKKSKLFSYNWDGVIPPFISGSFHRNSPEVGIKYEYHKEIWEQLEFSVPWSFTPPSELFGWDTDPAPPMWSFPTHIPSRELTYPTKREVRKIIIFKMPIFGGYLIVPWRVVYRLYIFSMKVSHTFFIAHYGIIIQLVDQIRNHFPKDRRNIVKQTSEWNKHLMLVNARLQALLLLVNQHSWLEYYPPGNSHMPPKMAFWRWFSFSRLVGYVNSLEGTLFNMKHTAESSVMD